MSFQDLAAGLRNLSALPILPGDAERPLQAFAGDYRVQGEQDDRLFRQLLDQRHMAFEALFQQLQTATQPFGMQVSKSDENGRLSLLDAELKTVELPKATINSRSASVWTRHGDRIALSLNGASTIRKPWPDPTRPGQLDRGFLNVIRDDRQVTSGLGLELHWTNGTPVWFVSEVNRLRPFVANDMERLIRIAIEHGFSGLAYPTPIVQPAGGQQQMQFWEWPFDPDIKRWCEALKRPIPIQVVDRLKIAIEMAFTEPGLLVSNQNMARSGSFIGEFFRQPPAYSERLKIVQRATERFIATFGYAFEVLYKLDVVVVDPSTNKLRVSIAGACTGRARTFNKTTSWTTGGGRRKKKFGDEQTAPPPDPYRPEFECEFDVEFPTTQMLMERARARASQRTASGPKKRAGRSKPTA